MKDIITIKCPNCQSSDCTEVKPNLFSCNFCKTKFIIREDVPQVVNNTTIFNGGSIDTKKIVPLVLIFVVVIPILILLLTTLVGRHKSSPFSSAQTDDAISGVRYAIAVPSKKGVNIWYQCSNYNNKAADGLNYQSILDIRDPITFRSLKRQVLLNTDKHMYTHLSDPMLYCKGNCFINTGTGFVAFDAETFTETENSATLASRHPELSSGIMECEFSREDNRFISFKLKNGRSLAYFIPLDTLLPVKSHWVSLHDYPELSKQFLDESSNKSYFVFFKVKKASQNTDDFFNTEDFYTDDTYNLYLIKNTNTSQKEPLSDRVYYFPLLHYLDNEKCVISYLNDADKDNSPRIVQCLSTKDGSEIWTCADQRLLAFSNDYYAEKTIVGGESGNQQLVFCKDSQSLSKEDCRAIGINMVTGKIIFVVKGEG